MEGTPQATDIYIFGSGQPGNVLMVLGGVHGNEPGGWFGAERLMKTLRPNTGAFLVVPYANKLATQSFVRTTDELGDLNRLYPGDPNGRKPGDRVEVVHKDFGRDPVVGELVASSVHEIAVRRRDDRAGEVVVHFPREHYTVMPA